MDLVAATAEATTAPHESGPIFHESDSCVKDGVDMATTYQPSDSPNQSKNICPETSVDVTAENINKNKDSGERPTEALESVTSTTKISASKKQLRPKAPMTYKFEPFDEMALLTPPADTVQGAEKSNANQETSNPSKTGRKRGRPFKLDAQGNPIHAEKTASREKKSKLKTKKTTNTSTTPKLEINETDRSFAKIQKQNILKLRADGHREYLDAHIMAPLYRSLQKILTEKPDRPLQTLANLLLEEDKRVSNNSIL